MEVPSIGVAEVRERMDSGEVLLVDVGEREEWRGAYPWSVACAVE